jgi:uncharacterized integral membrane protein (TIGR00698 family)
MYQKYSLPITRLFFILLIILCLMPFMSAAFALSLGIVFSLLLGNPYLDVTRRYSQRLLQFSIIGLGAGMNLAVVGFESLHGIGYTVVGITATMLIGLTTGKWLKIKPNTSLLITIGTAICGGSAIAAIAPVIRAKPQEISVALAIVFFLNAAALFIFPPLGHYFNLTQPQFGLWSALAIHDTSSVIGAAMHYGHRSVEIATTVKLARALWIFPLALLIGVIESRKHQQEDLQKPRFPLFILGFLLAAALVTWVPTLQSTGILLCALAKRTLVITLFLIGSTFTHSALKTVGIKPFIQGFALWITMASITLIALLGGYIY